MNWRISLVIIAVGLFACKQGKVETTSSTSVSSPYLLNAKELFKVYKRENTKLIDFRTEQKYKGGHIPGAIQIWRSDIEDTSYAYKGIMASPSHIEKLFSDLGIDSQDTLILYDDIGLCNASRLWWILQNYNFTNVKMLDGGLISWEAIGGEMSTEVPNFEKTVFQLGEPTMQYYVSKEDVLKALEEETPILDTRTEDEFAGKQQKKGASKAGRIPNSIHIDWAEAIDYNGDRKFKSTEELEEVYGRMDVDKEMPIIVYCHSGVRSAHTSFVLIQLLGYKNVKNYDGSWTEWSFLENLPFEKDTITTNN